MRCWKLMMTSTKTRRKMRKKSYARTSRLFTVTILDCNSCIISCRSLCALTSMMISKSSPAFFLPGSGGAIMLSRKRPMLPE